MPLREQQRQRLIRALFVNIDTWIEQALVIADHPTPHQLALTHARNLMQARGALLRLMAPEDREHAPPQPDVNPRLPQ